MGDVPQDSTIPPQAPPPPPPSPESGGSGQWGKFGSVLVGLVLLVLGIAIVGPWATPNGTMLTLGALVAALGAGVLATVLLPHAIEVGGQQVKPFGIDVKASGGAAVFVLALAFFYFSNPAAGEDKPAPQETATPAPTGSPTDAPTGEPTGTPSDGPTDGPPDPAPPVQTAVQPGPLADPFGSQSPLPRGMSRARTYCSQCCNGNPIGCPSVGGGIAYSYQDAAQIAFQMCVENGGVDQYCYANMQQF